MSRARLAALLALAPLAACAGAPTRIHTLDAVPAAAPVARAVTPFRVDAAHIPPALDRPELVRRRDRYTVTLSDTDRWAAPLGELVRRALTQDLLSRLPPGAVIFPDAPKPATARGLVVDILSVAETDRGVEMEASWSWVSARASAPVDPRAPTNVALPRVVRLTTAGAGAQVEAVAPELSALLALLADEIARDAAER